MKLRNTYTCPLELTHDMMKGKWKPIIVWRLRLGPTSLSKLEKDIEGITQKMLLEQLKELQEFHIVDKKVYDGYPLRVEYFLSDDFGTEVLKTLEVYQTIGIRYMKENAMEDVLDAKGLL